MRQAERSIESIRTTLKHNSIGSRTFFTDEIADLLAAYDAEVLRNTQLSEQISNLYDPLDLFSLVRRRS